ncbi:hypothetical protein JCM33374_g5600 [Metschnikowia sp. JCM 33374]|nr:hypothetical protein JCM33374_g5600 [Metschnikowia sp. JCM 33374]
MSQVRQAIQGPGIACPLPFTGPAVQASLDRTLQGLVAGQPAPVPQAPSPSPDLPTSLTALINDCFQSTMDAHVLSAERVEYVNRFKKYLAECHSSENLAFIMEIFRYEYFYDRLIPEADRPVVSKDISSSLVDRSLEQFIDKLPYPTPSMGKHLRKTSTKSPSTISLASSSTGAPFDLEFDEPVSNAHDAWNHLSLQHISRDSESGSDSDADSLLDAEGDADTLLSDQWHFIMSTYIEERSEFQINLSNKTYRALVECDATKTSHPTPSVLMAAKKEVMSLIHENTYHPFTKMMKSCACSSSSGCSAASNSIAGSAVGSPHSSGRNTQSSPGIGSAPGSAPGPAPGQSRTNSSTPSSTNSSRGEPTIAVSQPVPNLHKETVSAVAPVPQKKRTKFLQTLSGHTHGHSTSSSEASSPSTPFNSILPHLKQQHSSTQISRSYSSAPHSPASPSTPARRSSPFSTSTEDPIPRPRSSAVAESHHSHSSTSILGKLWRKRK